MNQTRVISILLAVMVSLAAMAEESYYYCGSSKIRLIKDPNKAVVLTPKRLTNTLKSAPSIRVLRSLSADLVDMTVIQKNGTIKLSDLMTILPDNSAEIAVYPSYTDEQGKPVIPTGYIYVQLKSESDYQKLQQQASKYGCRIVGQNTFMPLWYTLQVSAKSVGDCVDIANKIYESGFFSNAEPSFAFDLYISYDPESSSQWGLYNKDYEDIDISVSKAWNYSTGKGVTVAVIDQGIQLDHRDLAPNINPKSYDAFKKRSPSEIYDTEEEKGHGTHCAGIIGAVRNNNIAIAGVAPDVKLMSISLNFNVGNTAEQIADGINWAWKNGADVLSYSIGRRNPCDLIQNAVDSALTYGREKRGCIMVCAAGNDTSSVSFPANYRKEIIAVGNLKRDGTINISSNYGEELMVCAPGTHILSTTNNDSIGSKSGTSMACPHVAGIVALMLQINPNLSINKVREIIAKNTKKKPNMSLSKTKEFGSWNEKFGYGLVDAYKAVLNTPRN